MLLVIVVPMLNKILSYLILMTITCFHVLDKGLKIWVILNLPLEVTNIDAHMWLPISFQ